MIHWTEPYTPSALQRDERRIVGICPVVTDCWQDFHVRFEIEFNSRRANLAIEIGRWSDPCIHKTFQFNSICEAKQYAEDNLISETLDFFRGIDRNTIQLPIRFIGRNFVKKLLEIDLGILKFLDVEYLDPEIREEYFGHISLAEINL